MFILVAELGFFGIPNLSFRTLDPFEIYRRLMRVLCDDYLSSDFCSRC